MWRRRKGCMSWERRDVFSRAEDGIRVVERIDGPGDECKRSPREVPFGHRGYHPGRSLQIGTRKNTIVIKPVFPVLSRQCFSGLKPVFIVISYKNTIRSKPPKTLSSRSCFSIYLFVEIATRSLLRTACVPPGALW